MQIVLWHHQSHSILGNQHSAVQSSSFANIQLFVPWFDDFERHNNRRQLLESFLISVYLRGQWLQVCNRPKNLYILKKWSRLVYCLVHTSRRLQQLSQRAKSLCKNWKIFNFYCNSRWLQQICSQSERALKPLVSVDEITK